MRSLSWAFCPSRALRRVSNRPSSPVMTRATSGFDLRARSSGWNVTALAPSRSASSRPWRAHSSVRLVHHDGEVRLGDGLVEPDHDVARLDAVAVAHAQLADDAAGRMLHLLDVGVDDERARRDHGPGELGRRGEPADAAGKERDHGEPAEEMAADRTLRWCWFCLMTPLLGLPPSASCRRSGVSAVCAARPRAAEHLRRAPRPSDRRPGRARPPSSARGRPRRARSGDGRSRPRSGRARGPTGWPASSACSPSASRFEFGSSRTIRNGSP